MLGKTAIIAASALAVVVLALGDVPVVGAPGREAQDAWSFEMWCLEMQLYPTKRCDARTPQDLRDYQQYRADVETYHQTQQQKQKRDQDILQRLNQNLPGSAGTSGR